MYSSAPVTQNGNDWAPILDVLNAVFSFMAMLAINIVVSGHLLGLAFGLSNEGENYLNIPLRPVLALKVSGDRVVAGFTAFAVSLLFVLVFLVDYAENLFVKRLAVTESVFTASQALATLLSVVTCLVISAVVHGFRQYRQSIRSVRNEADHLRQLFRR